MELNNKTILDSDCIPPVDEIGTQIAPKRTIHPIMSDEEKAYSDSTIRKMFNRCAQHEHCEYRKETYYGTSTN